MIRLPPLAPLLLIALLSLSLWRPASVHCAEAASASVADDEKPPSPWLLTPTLSSDPKLGTSVGGLVGYLVKFDDESPTSMFGVAGSYSVTGSKVGAIFARTYFDGDRHRLMAMIGGGIIDNDYEDFLGSGVPVSTRDDLRIYALRYLKQVKKRWYLGGQIMRTNYAIAGNDNFSQEAIDLVGLVGFDSVAIGLVGQYDSRDNQNSPSAGKFFSLNNNAFRKALGGDEDFDVYQADLRFYTPHGRSLVLATKATGRWTVDAPTGALSSIDLRGYTRGQYLGKHMTSIELDERIPLGKSFGASIYGGLACLYGGEISLDDRDSWFPALATGISYELKPEEKMVVRLDVAVGRGDNRGLYLSFGHPF